MKKTVLRRMVGSVRRSFRSVVSLAAPISDQKEAVVRQRRGSFSFTPPPSYTLSSATSASGAATVSKGKSAAMMRNRSVSGSQIGILKRPSTL